MNDRTGIGGNHPPSELDLQQPIVDDALELAGMTLTGIAVETDKQNDAMGVLIDTIKAAKKKVNAAFEIEKQPIREAGNAVDDKKNGMLKHLDTALTTAQGARTGYLNKIETQRLETARIAQEEADRAQQAAQEAHATKDVADLDDAQAADDADAVAKDTRIKASVAKKPVATNLRTVWHTKIADMEAALNTYFDDPRLNDALLGMAKSDVHGGKREIPGFEITSTREAR